MANEFKNALKGVDKAIKVGTQRALNRALSQSKTKMVRSLREDTGLKTDVVKSRTRAKKARGNSLDVILRIAIQFAISLSKFGPKAKKVRAQYKDGTKRARTGATAKIGRAPRQLVPGAFILKRGDGVAVGRADAYNAQGEYVDSTTQGKLVNLKTKAFTESAKANEAPVTKLMMDTFNRIVGHEIDFAIQKVLKAKR